MAASGITTIKTVSIADLPIWQQAKHDRTLLSVVLELTARCNNNCVHCYINRPANDCAAKNSELTFEEIKKIADEAVDLGALWFLLSGGEPLLRPDFAEIYRYLKKKGLLVSIFTNGSLITADHIQLFTQYPPREIEVTVYGASEKVHRKVTGKNTFSATMAAIDVMLANHLPVTLKTTVMRSNLDEFDNISEYCRAKSGMPFRFDPMLQYRLDGDQEKNRTIQSERLTVDEIIELEQKDPVRHQLLAEHCSANTTGQTTPSARNTLFRCRAGINSCCIDCTGKLRLCSSLVNNDCVVDVKEGSLTRAWNEFVPKVLQTESKSSAFEYNCGQCSLHDVCSWCPAHADLETGSLDGHIEYFCTIAKTKYEHVTSIVNS